MLLTCIDHDLSADIPFSLSFYSCQCLKCAYLANIHQKPVDFSLQSVYQLVLGSHVMSMNMTPVITIGNIHNLLSSIQNSTNPAPATTL